MKIAIIGGGISGLTVAHLLHEEHDLTLFEANDYVGGHTHTHEIEAEEGGGELIRALSYTMKKPILISSSC